ncbi:hypothetical protein EN935_24625 [Mesorhizobium sp. M7D.F.Ca.US.004.03.1.1]|nr:hypothetical protein EN993_10065 [Mesorhizobium sp. M7D.F.Ca.US.004.01.2.1]RVA25270.1 hypothetical protein EN935_24625 [Mesorhizobium sp. M7D.F.Ca.US.004.03.1.1]
MVERRNYNREHVATGWMRSGGGGPLTVGDLRNAIADLPDHAEMIFGTCDHGQPLSFSCFKTRGESLIQIEFG